MGNSSPFLWLGEYSFCEMWRMEIVSRYLKKKKNNNGKRFSFYTPGLTSVENAMPACMSQWGDPDCLTCTSVEARQDHEQMKKIYDPFKGTVQYGRAGPG